ncbi:MAG: hypothetical protein RI894_951 [Bacteroidota bacterium]|jgi:6-phosphofructokinase 1
MNKRKIRHIAVMCSGGDAPGMNAAVRAAVRAGIYHGFQVTGVVRGYEGLINADFIQMDSRTVGDIIQRGGTMLKTARSERFRTPEGRKTAFENMQAYEIDAIVAIGGNGTFTGGNVFYEEYGIPFVGIPGTIDNDLFGTDFTIGYDTACNTVIDALDKIRDTADAHDRLFFIEVMGRDAGFIALNAGIAAGVEAILLPEEPTDIEVLIERLSKNAKKKKPSSMVIVAEGNTNGGAIEIAKKVNEKFKHYDTKVTIIGHLQRGGSPSCFDRVLASRLGVAAVDTLANLNKYQDIGDTDTYNANVKVMVGVEKDAIVRIPLAETFKKENRKLINPELLEIAQLLAL